MIMIPSAVFTGIEAGLRQADVDRLLADTEVLGEGRHSLDAIPPGGLELPLRKQCAASEVVGSSLCLLCGGAAACALIELVAIAVIDDVLELVEQREALASQAVAAVDGDDPEHAVPVAHARDAERLVGDGDAGEPGDVNIAGAVALVEEVVQERGLVFGNAKRFVEADAALRDDRAEALER